MIPARRTFQPMDETSREAQDDRINALRITHASRLRRLRREARRVKAADPVMVTLVDLTLDNGSHYRCTVLGTLRRGADSPERRAVAFLADLFPKRGIRWDRVATVTAQAVESGRAVWCAQVRLDHAPRH